MNAPPGSPGAVKSGSGAQGPSPDRAWGESTRRRLLAGAWVCVTACLAGFLLRLWRIDAQSLWWDEAISLHLATSPVATILADRAAHVNPPLYFLLLKWWVAVAGASAFSARFLSVWFSVLLIPATYAFGRRFLDRRTGLTAALLTAISALYVVYSQEARVYALLPLVYLALLALAERLTWAPCRAGESRSWREWLLLVGVQVIGLHLHYAILFAVAYVNLLLWAGLRGNRRAMVRWLVSLALVALLCLPWLAAGYGQRAAVMTDAGIDDPFVESLPLGFFINLLWTFQWTGLTAATGNVGMQVLSLVVAALLLVGLALLSRRARLRRTSLRLLIHWLGPLLPAVLLWQAKPLSHPRYVLTFSVALFLLTSYVVTQAAARRALGRLTAVLLAVSVALLSIVALGAWYPGPQFATGDVAALATWLQDNVHTDLVIVPSQDWSLDFGSTASPSLRERIIRPDPADEAATWRALSGGTQAGQRVFLVSYPRDDQDPRNVLPFALEMAGSLVERRSFKGLHVRVYALENSVNGPPARTPADARFGPLRLTSSWIEASPPADTAVTVALGWRLEEPVDARYRVNLRLHDLDGGTWRSVDNWLLDERGRPSNKWAAGEETVTYHIIPTPPGAPPLTYTVSLGVYTTAGTGDIVPEDLLDARGNPSGRTYEAGVVTLKPAAGILNDPYEAAPDLTPLADPAALDDHLLLEAAALDREAAAPGQSVFVTLRWRAASAPLPDLRPALVLEQEGSAIETAGEAPANGRYPTDRWQPDEIVLERRRLTIPPTAKPGLVTVTAQLGDRRVVLGTLEVETSQALFAPPPMDFEVGARFGDVAELVGYDLPPEPYVSGQPITVTLYWRGLDGASGADYTVFAHLLAADGHLVAQHDGPPAAGARPTRGWLPGEIVIDPHGMTFREPYVGTAVVEIGLYDGATLDRVPLADGETSLILPTLIRVREP